MKDLAPCLRNKGRPSRPGIRGFCALWARKVLKIDRPNGQRVLRFDTPYDVRVKVVPAAQFIVHFALLTSLGKHKNPSPRSKKQEARNKKLKTKNYYY